MDLLRTIFFLTLLSGVLAIVSNINLNPTGYYPKISTKGGLYVSIVILIYMIFGELGYLPWLRFVGKKKRSLNGNLLNSVIFGDRNTILTVRHLFIYFFLPAITQSDYFSWYANLIHKIVSCAIYASWKR